MIVHDCQAAPAAANMERDAHFLADLTQVNEPILHFYEWQGDAATYGHFVKPEEYLNMAAVKRAKLDLARRPTGGGIVFHLCDLAFSYLVPATHRQFSKNTMENYAIVNGCVRQALELFGPVHFYEESAVPLDTAASRFCMAQPTRYDLLWQGRKIGGAAQRQTRNGFLHQGTISIAPLPGEYLQAILLPGTRVFEAMRAHSAFLLPGGAAFEELACARKSLKAKLTEAFLAAEMHTFC